MTRGLAANEPIDKVTPPSTSSLPQNVLNYIFIDCLKNEYSLVSAEETKSAQQQVVIIQVTRNAETETDQNGSITTLDTKWLDCLKNGRNRLVVRIWKGGSNWWNLNRNQDPLILARQEIQGYQLAHQAFQKEENQTISIPRVLHYQLSCADNEESSASSYCCWAVLEYVGLHSTLFDAERHRIPDSWYMERMIKIRHEFGFDEPHPRWGRVPTEDCLEYATMVLNEVVLPLQKHTKQQWTIHHDDDANNNNDHNRKISQNFGTMLQKYQNALEELLSCVSPNNDSDADVTRQTDERMRTALKIVKEAVTQILPQHLSQIPPMAPVLVHLDLQPQNLLFYRTTTQSSRSTCQGEDDHDSDLQQHMKSMMIHISSVLDWEDACLADPRLEILLLCRKVCANRSQADALWSLFEQSGKNHPGTILPWLQLECIHSILTLLLQSMDLLNGGRNPWETKKDLWGKLQREFYRWNELLDRNDNNIMASNNSTD